GPAGRGTGGRRGGGGVRADAPRRRRAERVDPRPVGADPLGLEGAAAQHHAGARADEHGDLVEEAALAETGVAGEEEQGAVLPLLERTGDRGPLGGAADEVALGRGRGGRGPLEPPRARAGAGGRRG